MIISYKYTYTFKNRMVISIVNFNENLSGEYDLTILSDICEKRITWVAISTHEGEEEYILKVDKLIFLYFLPKNKSFNCLGTSITTSK